MDDFFDGGFGGGNDEPTSFTDTAQICMNGHIINDSYVQSPELNKKYCPKCGEPTIITCPECSSKIAGEIHYNNVFGTHSFKLPAFCIECGIPYPWTVSRLKAAKELVSELEELSAVEQKTLEMSIDEISKDNPQASVGATRIKKIMGKVRNATGDTLQKIIIEVASETAKKILLGN